MSQDPSTVVNEAASRADLLGELARLRRLTELQGLELIRKDEEIQRTRAEAQLAAGVKDDFLAHMSHEIRTPMTAIVGYAEMLMNEEGLDRAPQHRRQAIETIQRNGEHLLSVINDILDLSKIEADKMRVERVDFSCRRTMDDVVALMGMRATLKGIELRTEFEHNASILYKRSS